MPRVYHGLRSIRFLTGRRRDRVSPPRPLHAWVGSVWLSAGPPDASWACSFPRGLHNPDLTHGSPAVFTRYSWAGPGDQATTERRPSSRRVSAGGRLGHGAAGVSVELGECTAGVSRVASSATSSRVSMPRTAFSMAACRWPSASEAAARASCVREPGGRFRTNRSPGRRSGRVGFPGHTARPRRFRSLHDPQVAHDFRPTNPLARGPELGEVVSGAASRSLFRLWRRR